MDVILAPQYEEYLISEPPTVESSMADCAAAKLDCANLKASITLTKLDIKNVSSAIADFSKKAGPKEEADSEEYCDLMEILGLREAKVKILEEGFVS